MDPHHTDKILSLATSLLKKGAPTPTPLELAQLLSEICLIYPGYQVLLEKPYKETEVLNSRDASQLLSSTAMTSAIESGSTEKLAYLSFFFDRDQFATILSRLLPHRLIDVLMEVSTLSYRPFSEVEDFAFAYLLELKTRLAASTPVRAPVPPPFRHRVVVSNANNTAEFAHRQNIPEKSEFDTIRILI